MQNEIYHYLNAVRQVPIYEAAEKALVAYIDEQCGTLEGEAAANIEALKRRLHALTTQTGQVGTKMLDAVDEAMHHARMQGIHIPLTRACADHVIAESSFDYLCHGDKEPATAAERRIAQFDNVAASKAPMEHAKRYLRQEWKISPDGTKARLQHCHGDVHYATRLLVHAQLFAMCVDEVLNPRFLATDSRDNAFHINFDPENTGKPLVDAKQFFRNMQHALGGPLTAARA